MIKDLLPWKKDSELDISSKDLFSEFQTHVDRFFGNLCTAKDSDFMSPFGSKLGNFNPRFDVTEMEDKFEIKAELPGMSKKDIEITLEDNVLKIKGEKKEEVKKEKCNYHVSERRFGSFERAFRLSEEAKLDEIKANFKNGELIVVLPKAEIPKKEVKKIDVGS